jgi:cation transport regulator
MPYANAAELPVSVRANLPPHAQEIYKEAFNNAWSEYADASKRRGSESRDETSHRVAWAAVEKSYVKNSATGKWEKK